MYEPVETIEYKGYTIKVHQDEFPESPREWDNLGTMVCWHRNYNLGDEQPKVSPNEYLEILACEVDSTAEGRIDYWHNDGWQRIWDSDGYEYADAEVTKRTHAIVADALDRYVIMLPLYVYEHGGITMSTGAFSCPWDSGQVGFIYVTKERVREEYGKQRISKKMRAQVIEYLKGEVETYASYLEGMVFGYTVEDPEGEETDMSCYGFYGYNHKESGLLGEAQGQIDWHIENQKRIAEEARARAIEVHVEQVKTWIKNHVPLEYRKPLELPA